MNASSQAISGGVVAGSFRDPAGFVFEREGRLLRQVNRAYEDEFRALTDSGLYRRLFADGLLVPHEEASDPAPDPQRALCVIRPERIPFVSYPHEWCFGQLRDAALLTLEVQKRALEHGMTLKDASAYNVQFRGARPVHIDSLSFARYREGEPWTAYRQFCEHFLAPLALCGMTDARLARMLAAHLDGVPLDLACALLPARSWAKPGLAMHLQLHARFQRRFAAGAATAKRPRVSRTGMLALIDSLERSIAAIPWRPRQTVWTGYEGGATDAYRARKLEAVKRCIDGRRLGLVYDLGANVGAYGRAAGGELVVCADADPWVVDVNYAACKRDKDANILPLVIDLANPTPAIGWENTERAAFLQRGRPQLVLALALVHHLAIANNVPLPGIAGMFRRLTDEILVEFVPETDPQAGRLIAARGGAVHPYARGAFESAFGALYRCAGSHPLSDTGRTLYHYKAGA